MASAEKHVKAKVDGWGITVATLPEAVDAIIAKARTGLAFSVFTLNLDHIVKLRRNTRFRDAYRAADIVTADGWPIAMLARSQDRSIRRTTGADIVLPLIQEAALQQLPIFLFGTSADVMARTGRELGDQTDGLIDIAGTLAPSNTFDPEGAEADGAIAMIQTSGARLCFVALGAPKQELFAAYAQSKGVACGFICVGAALDFLVGTQVRAPETLRNSGFEWAWRLATNPRRLARRYGECAVVFADLVFLAPVRERVARARL